MDQTKKINRYFYLICCTSLCALTAKEKFLITGATYIISYHAYKNYCYFAGFV